MKHTKKLSAIILSAVMLMTACSGSTSSDSGTQIKDSDPAASENAGTDDSADSTDSSNDTVSASKSVKDVIGDIKVDTKVKILSWYDLNDTGVAKTYKELFGVPEKTPTGYEESNLKKNNSEGNVNEKPFANIQVTNYSSRYTDLIRLVQSDDSPDCIPFEEGTFIRMLGEKEELLQNVDDVIDFGIKELALYKSESDKLSFEGKHYVPITDLSIDHMIWYKTSVIAENGLDDPWELYQKGEWTWDKFMEMSKQFADSKNGKYALDGYLYTISDAFLSTTGETFITLDDNGRYKNNCKNDKIYEYMDYLRRFAASVDGLRYPNERENGGSANEHEWADGNTLFFIGDQYYYETKFSLYKKRNKWSDDEIKIVPMPSLDKEQTEYQPMSAEGYLLIKGAKNTEGYKSLVYAFAYQNNNLSDEEMKAYREEMKSEGGWSDMLLDRIAEINTTGKYHAVFEISNPVNVYDVCFYSTPYSECVYNCLVNGSAYKAYLENNTDIVEYFDRLVGSANGEE